ncbi:NADP-dependent oxidoreductase [Polaribacter sp. IC073]|uniref:NADP-dependent oxidoreductase n=1 Tax=Polaribacter sp. IC073 TaxID=2508540 RepID=UPI0011BEBFF2|nr:NADP-dependent oxidoreductase [Polaribacter sp. IC073]TXD49434.1 NADP-dependent oxidoreductase [Polaribacter sp. IC073]
MKAIQHTAYEEISKSITFSEIERPTITKDQVLVEAYASSINPLDIKVLQGKLKMVPNYILPATMGYDVSGKIVAVGENVTDLKVGDEVYTYDYLQGAFAEFVAISQNNISLKPNNLNFEEAASLPLVSLTAYQALKRGELKPGDKVLIHAGSGGVGSIAIQLAKAKGAYVYTTTSTKNVAWVKALGADCVIDYKTEDYKTIVKDADMVLDPLGAPYTEDAFKVIKKGGKVITLVGLPDKETAKQMNADLDALSHKRRKITAQIELKAAFYSLVLLKQNAKQLDEITQLVEVGKICTVIDKIIPLEETMEALEYVSKGHTKGKVVIKIK